MKNLFMTTDRHNRLNAAWQKNPTLESLLGALEDDAGRKEERERLVGKKSLVLRGVKGGKRFCPAQLVVVVPGIVLLLPLEGELEVKEPLSYAGLLYWGMTNGCGMWVATSFGPNPYGHMVGLESRFPDNGNEPSLVFRGDPDIVFQITTEHYAEIHEFLTYWVDFNLGEESKKYRNAVIASDEDK